MKNKNLNTRFLIVLVLLLGACKEKPVIIPDFSVPKGDRNVLIEEFTGVRCVNCPNGAKIIEEMVAEFGDRVVPISIHHGFFAKPLKQSKSDLNCHCGYGDAVTETLGKGPIGYPAAVINRQKLGSKLFPNKDEWKSIVLNALKQPAPVNIFLKVSGDASNSQWTLDVNLAASEPLDDLFITAVLLESDIIDAQILPDNSLDENYNFQHVVRMPITDAAGESLPALASGEVKEMKGFKTFALQPEWDYKHCSIAVFVHHKSTGTEVLQAASIHLEN